VAKVRIEAPVKGESHRKTETPRTYSRARLSLTLLDTVLGTIEPQAQHAKSRRMAACFVYVMWGFSLVSTQKLM
ncbi:MAG: hypothetical protein OXC60_13460, partial [Litoreibacter sp.]|nr:hypothetical protein [Litoreibacter sp.]